MVPITMICPNLKCRQTVVTPPSARGKVVRCPHCRQLFMVPERVSNPVAAPEAEPDPNAKNDA